MSEPTAGTFVQRWKRPKRLDKALGRQLTPLVKRRGFARAELITRWREIVGEPYASYSRPELLRFPPDQPGDGTLTLMIESAWALRFTAATPILLDKINRFFGYNAVRSLKILHGSLNRHNPLQQAAQPPLTLAQEKAIATQLANIQDQGLREALAKLGRHFPTDPE